MNEEEKQQQQQIHKHFIRVERQIDSHTQTNRHITGIHNKTKKKTTKNKKKIKLDRQTEGHNCIIYCLPASHN